MQLKVQWEYSGYEKEFKEKPAPSIVDVPAEVWNTQRIT